VFDARWYSDWRPDRGRSQEHQSRARTAPRRRRFHSFGAQVSPAIDPVLASRGDAECGTGASRGRMARALRPMRELFPLLRFPATLANAYGCTQFAGRASPDLE
jgi:hypothetical protein